MTRQDPLPSDLSQDSVVMRVRGLTKRYHRLAAVDDLSLAFGTGTITGIVGPNGAGKTTLFGLLAGAIKPDAGSVSYLGREITSRSARSRSTLGIARTFQTARNFPELTVRENLLVGVSVASGHRPSWFRSHNRESRRCAELVAEAAAVHGLAAELHTPARNLPQAFRKHLDLAMALLQRPRLLLLDEPTAGVAADDVASIEARLREVRAHNADAAILITSHDVDLISRLADRLMVMVRGRQIAYGRTDSVIDDPAVQHAYLGMGSR